MALVTTECGFQKEAFEYYYSLGNERSLVSVAKKFDRTLRTVSGWRRKYLWDDRIAQRDIETGENTTTAVKTDYRVIINILMEYVADKIESGEIAVNSIEDLEKLIKLDLLLMGEPTGRVKVSVVDLPEEIRTLLDKKIEELKQK